MAVDYTTLPEKIGRYVVQQSLGCGAMGRVLLAIDPVLERKVAVKLLRQDLPVDADQRERLLERMRQEAKASARVSHPNIVALHDMGESADFGLYLVFEYLDGPSLHQAITHGPLPPSEVATLAREMGGALSFAHAAGVLHRDIKPENVIVTRTGSKIADFGIARLPDSTLTRDGGLLGTPAYSAPESISEGLFSPLSDEFSLAATLYEALSGTRAFPGEDAVAVAAKITTEDAPPIAARLGLSSRVDAVLAKGLSRRPSGRYESCAAFAEALANAMGFGGRASIPTLPDAYHRRQERLSGRARRAIAAAMVLGLVGGVIARDLWNHAGMPTSQPANADSRGRPRPAPTAWLAPSATAQPAAAEAGTAVPAHRASAVPAHPGNDAASAPSAVNGLAEPEPPPPEPPDEDAPEPPPP